jgi:endonuclease YncB( thermonuclease family)
MMAILFFFYKGSKLRLLSINTPEVGSPHRPGEPGGEEARLLLKTAIYINRVLVSLGYSSCQPASA